MGETDDVSVDSETIDISIEENVGKITINGVNQLNAIDAETADALRQAVIDLNEDDTVRCITLTGAGTAFSAGADLASFEGDERDAPRIRALASTLHDAIIQLHQADKPVVTALNGIAAGGGFGLALVGDIVLVSEDARLDFAYQRVGLTGDCGSTFFLPRLVGLGRAKELVLHQEPLEPDRAVELGLATETVSADEFGERLDEIAGRLASGPTKAFGATKQLMTESFERELPAQLAAETDTIADAARTEDYGRGHTAFFTDDDPEFVGR